MLQRYRGLLKFNKCFSLGLFVNIKIILWTARKLREQPKSVSVCVASIGGQRQKHNIYYAGKYVSGLYKGLILF